MILRCANPMRLLQKLDAGICPINESRYGRSDWWTDRCNELANGRPLGCMGTDFGPANDIPLGGEGYVSRTTLTRNLCIP